MAEPKERGGFPFEKLLGNPELLSGLLSLFANGSKQEQASDDTNTAEASATGDGLPRSSEEGETEGLFDPAAEAGEEATGQLPAEEGDLAPAFSPLPLRGHGHGRGKKREMLCALKPYMSHRRCDMIDKILHAADLVDLFRK